MDVFLLSLILFLAAIGGLAVGILFGKAPIRGSCGGLSCARDFDCAGCPNRRREGIAP
jgi:hypothetical protein